MPSVSQATVTNASADVTAVTIVSALSHRRGLDVFNDSTAAMYLKFGTAATTTSFTVKIAAAGFFEMAEPIFVGDVTAVWDSATGAARVTELR